MPAWTEEMQTTMVTLLAEGKSCSEVGEVLGITRNAVIGRAHRTKVSIGELNGYIQGSKKANWKKKLLKLYDFSVGVRPMGNKKPKKFAVNRAAWVKPPEDTVTKCLFGALDDHLCHWPLWGNDGVGERFYCGAPVEGKTYCHDHWFAATEPRHSRREPVRPFVINKRPANPPKSIVA